MRVFVCLYYYYVLLRRFGSRGCLAQRNRLCSFHKTSSSFTIGLHVGQYRTEDAFVSSSSHRHTQQLADEDLILAVVALCVFFCNPSCAAPPSGLLGICHRSSTPGCMRHRLVVSSSSPLRIGNMLSTGIASSPRRPSPSRPPPNSGQRS